MGNRKLSKMADLVPGKVISIILWIVATVLATYSPFIFKGLRKHTTTLSIINTYGGGIFFAGGLIHILPEALHKMEAWYKPGHDDDHRLRLLEEEEEEKTEHFPWPAFAAVLLFCGQLMLEKAAIRAENASWLFAAGMALHSIFAGLALGLQKTAGSFMALTIGIFAHKFSESISVGLKIFETVQPGELAKYQELERQTNGSDAKEGTASPNAPEGNKITPIPDGEEVEEQQVAVVKADPEEGMTTNRAEGSPKVADAKPISKCDKIINYIVLGIFCLALPLGIGIGMAVHDVDQWTEGFLLGLSAGTFIYTGTIHVVPEEFDNKKKLWWKALAYVLGFGTIVGVWFIEHKAFNDHAA